MNGIIHQSTSHSSAFKLLFGAGIAVVIAALVVCRTTDVAPTEQPVVSVTPVATLAERSATDLRTPSPPASVQAPTMRPIAPMGPAAGLHRPAEDFAERNSAIDAGRLTRHQPVSARAFLNEVVVTPEPKGGFIVSEVLRGSRFDVLGLRPGDVIYSLDSPNAPLVDETSMIALTSRSELHLDVYRNGNLVHLRQNLGRDAEAEHADGE